MAGHDDKWLLVVLLVWLPFMEVEEAGANDDANSKHYSSKTKQTQQFDACRGVTEVHIRTDCMGCVEGEGEAVAGLPMEQPDLERRTECSGSAIVALQQCTPKHTSPLTLSSALLLRC